jgi:hypothetical protein
MFNKATADVETETKDRKNERKTTEFKNVDRIRSVEFLLRLSMLKPKAGETETQRSSRTWIESCSVEAENEGRKNGKHNGRSSRTWMESTLA